MLSVEAYKQFNEIYLQDFAYELPNVETLTEYIKEFEELFGSNYVK